MINKKLSSSFVLMIALALPPLTLNAQEIALGEDALRALDTDGDDRISKEEWSAFTTFAFGAMDGDSNGTLGMGDVDPHLVTEDFQTLDANNDGVVTRTEFEKRMQIDFDAADRNGNGFID